MQESIDGLELMTSQQVREADNAAARAGEDTFKLMHRAGSSVAAAIKERVQPMPVLVLCGPGNNGGDGYVIAESLRADGWQVVCCATHADAPGRPDLLRAKSEYRGEVKVFDPAMLESRPLLVDAIFGSGLSRPLDGATIDIIRTVRNAKLPVVAVDIPSGVNADTGAIMGDSFAAAMTITFMRKKPGHLLFPGRGRCGEVLVSDIGMPGAILKGLCLNVCENDPALWIDAFPVRGFEEHKYHHGHCLVLGGGIQQTGAAKLAAHAALRSGAGLVSVACGAESLPVYAASFASIMTKQCDSSEAFDTLIADERVTALVLGPGAGVDSRTRKSVLSGLQGKKKTVLDADALTVFADLPSALFERLTPENILTPHAGEFERLFKINEPGLSRLDKVRRAAKLANAVVVLKGADTVIAEPGGRAVVNSNAPADLATAGSGDVLAGICGGLLAQGMPAFFAACAAVWMHGFAAAAIGPGLIAEDLTETLPTAIRMLRNLKE